MARVRGRHAGSGGGPGPAPGHGVLAIEQQRPPRDAIGLVLWGLGQTLITLGVVVLLFAAYEVWITNIFAHRRQAQVHHKIEQQWAQGTDILSLPQTQLRAHSGDGIANLYIPRLGADYAWTIVEGSVVPTDGELERGPARYADSQLPGQEGDFAVAGHRVGKGEPFLNLDKLKPGDAVVVETAQTWFVYCVLGAAAATPCDPTAPGASWTNLDRNGVPGQEVVPPGNGGVILPVPSKANAPMPYTTAYLTMTTCTPKFSATDRLIVHGVLDPQYPAGIAKQRSGAGYSTAIPVQVKSLYQKIGAL